MLTLGLLETKRESKADKSGDLAEIWGGFCVRELKLGVLVVVAMPPPYMAGVAGDMPRPKPTDGKRMGALRPLLMGSMAAPMPLLAAVTGKAVDILLL